MSTLLSSAIDLFVVNYLSTKRPSYTDWILGRLGDVRPGRPLRGNSLLATVGDVAVTSITATCLQGWANRLAASDLTADTVDGYRRAVVTFWRWMAKWPELPITADVVGVISWPETVPISETPPRAVSDEAVEAMLNTPMTMRDQAMLRFLLFTGVRSNEAATLTISRLHLRERYAQVHGKGGKRRNVVFDPLTAQVVECFLSEHRPDAPHDEVFLADSGAPITPSGIRQMVQRVAERAGVTELVSPHRLRHWWATKALAAGASPAFVQDQMGHADFNTTRRYARFTPSLLQKQYDAAFGAGYDAPVVSPGLFEEPTLRSRRRRTAADYHNLAQLRGIAWQGPLPRNVVSKTSWACADGHEWAATYSSIQQGTGCPSCAGVARKTADDYHALAAERRLFWVGPEPRNVHESTGWLCRECHHEWETAYATLREGSGCPQCVTRALALTEADYRGLAETKLVAWLGPLPLNTQTPTRWLCLVCDHEWEISYNGLRGCPACAVRRRRRGPDEYHALAARNGYRWLGPLTRSVEEKTWWECQNGHRWETDYLSVNGCPDCRRARTLPELAQVRGEATLPAPTRHTPEDYHALAVARGFVWLGPEVANVRTPTGWRCDRGHVWQASFGNVRMGMRTGTGCPTCARQRRRFGEEMYHALATERGFVWHGPMPQNSHGKSEWACGRGHRWLTTYKNVREGKGCPTCAGRK
ncbi:MAG: tyrosine-type recombinase/integrase [Anaerolinea sp.]|nr:tyrosine-type recombinase/integrase [Anaerolinea sp.]